MTQKYVMSKIKDRCNICYTSITNKDVGWCEGIECPLSEFRKNNFSVTTKRKKEYSIYDVNHVAYLAAEYIAKKIAWRKPGHPEIQIDKREKSIQRWAKDIDLLLRVDLGLKENTVSNDFKDVLKLSQSDEFWSKNILSGAALRKNYGKLLMRIDDQEMGM